MRHAIPVGVLGVALACSGSFAADAQVSADAWHTGFPPGVEWSDVRRNEIHSTRILVVPEKKRDEALELLEEAPYVPLDIRTARDILQSSDLSADAQLYLAAAEASRDADKCKYLATLPSSPEPQKWLKREKEHREVVERALSLRGELSPYLVRAVALWEATGAFSAFWHDGDLM